MGAGTEEIFVISNFKMLPPAFNRKKNSQRFLVPTTYITREIQQLARSQCYGKETWPLSGKLEAWMVTAETAVFMKMGGLGVIASELPEAYNRTYGKEGDNIKVVTPLYVGDTGKKKAELNPETLVYHGAEGKSVQLKRLTTIEVPFIVDENKLSNHRVVVYQTHCDGVDYILLDNPHFFSINPHKNNPSAQGGCYVLNENGVNEVERFAFFSKAIYVLLKDVAENSYNPLVYPNMIVANDWHCGELAGLLKYFTLAQEEQGVMETSLSEKLRNLPIIHIAHHLGYQGWDYKNTRRLLNSTYEYASNLIYKNAKAVKNANPRTQNTLIVYDCYNQAACSLHLADRVVTVSKNYMEEVSRFLEFGWDFRDILKIRKDHRTFSGIVNGYDKVKIAPNADKISHLNSFFDTNDFCVFDETSLDKKTQNKKAFLNLIGRLAVDEAFRKKKLPAVEFYKLNNLSKNLVEFDKVPVFCATSRMVEQKGYDIVADALLRLAQKTKKVNFSGAFPIFVLGGAGDADIFEYLKNVKDEVSLLNPKLGERIIIFHGYKDELAYAAQLASDFYLMPCRFEPCGLTQMEAMAKGALPLAMSTGGLVDTIINGVDGFRTEVFFVGKNRVYGSNLAAQRLKNNVNAFADMLKNVLEIFYRNPDIVSAMKVAAMKKDFSWSEGAIQKYYNLFHYGI